MLSALGMRKVKNHSARTASPIGCQAHLYVMAFRQFIIGNPMFIIYQIKAKKFIKRLLTYLRDDITCKRPKTAKEINQFLTAGSFPVRCPIRCALRNWAEVDAKTENFLEKTLIFCLFSHIL